MRVTWPRWARPKRLCSSGTAENACLLDSQLGQANCTQGSMVPRKMVQIHYQLKLCASPFVAIAAGTDMLLELCDCRYAS